MLRHAEVTYRKYIIAIYVKNSNFVMCVGLCVKNFLELNVQGNSNNIPRFSIFDTQRQKSAQSK